MENTTQTETTTLARTPTIERAITYFSLKHSVYATHFDNSIILLDADTDTYLSMIDDAAHYLPTILSQAFTSDADGYSLIHDTDNNKELNLWIQDFLERNLIVPSTHPTIRPLSTPLKEGGLCDYQWDRKPSWNPLKGKSAWHILKALAMLHRVHRTIKHAKIKGIIELIQSYSEKCNNLKEPTDQVIADLAQSVDAASALYPTKTFCLAWATTYVCMSLKKGWAAHLVIGVQTNPFYAHAWAESKATVVHDDPQIALVLSIILKTPISCGAQWHS